MKLSKKYIWLSLPVLVCCFILGGVYLFHEEKNISKSEASSSKEFLSKIKVFEIKKNNSNFESPKPGVLSDVKKIEEFSFAKDETQMGKNIATITFGLGHNFETADEHAKWVVEKEKAFRELEKNQNESVARIVNEYDSLDKYNLHAKASLLIILGRLGNDSSYKKLSEIAMKDESLPEGYKEIQTRESILAMTALITHAKKGEQKAKNEFENVKTKGSKTTREIASLMEKRFFTDTESK